MPGTIKINFEGNPKEFWAEFRKAAKASGADVPGMPKPGPAGKSFGAEFKKGISDSFKNFAIPALTTAGVGLGLAAVTKGFSDMLAKEDQLADFSAITGVAGEELERFGDIATDLSNKFGTTVTGNIESFKGILSRLGPDIAKSSEAVAIMGDNVNTLAIASGLDATQSMDALTTAMLQFGVDLDDPIEAAEIMTEQMNIMAAGAKEGAAEVPAVSEALKQVGSTAKSLNVDFVETNALIQTLALAGKQGSEAGIGLRNVLTSIVSVSGPGAEALKSMGLSVEDLSQTLTTKGANKALEQLKAGLDKLPTSAEKSAALVKIFGKENLASATALIENTKATEDFTAALEGTNTAIDQAGIKMRTVSARWDQFTSFLSNYAVNVLEVTAGSMLKVAFAATEMIAAIGEGEKARAKAASGFLGDVGDAFSSFVSFSTAGLVETGNVFESVGLITKKTGGEGKIGLDELAKGAENAAGALKGLGGAASDAEGKVKPAAGTIGAMREELKELTDELTNKLEPGSDAFLEASFKAQRLQTHIELVQRALKGLSRSDIPAVKQLESFKVEGAADLIDGEQFSLQVDTSVSALDRFIGKFDELGNAAEYFGETFGSIMSAGVGAILADSENASEAAKNFLKTVGNAAITAAEAWLFAGTAESFAKAVSSFGLTLVTDAPWLAAGFAALETGRAVLNSLDSGGFLPGDMPIQAHSKEFVVPWEKVPQLFAEAANQGAGGAAPRTRPQYTRATAQKMRGRVDVNVSTFSSAMRQAEIEQSYRGL